MYFGWSWISSINRTCAFCCLFPKVFQVRLLLFGNLLSACFDQILPKNQGLHEAINLHPHKFCPQMSGPLFLQLALVGSGFINCCIFTLLLEKNPSSHLYLFFSSLFEVTILLLGPIVGSLHFNSFRRTHENESIPLEKLLQKVFSREFKVPPPKLPPPGIRG